MDGFPVRNARNRGRGGDSIQSTCAAVESVKPESARKVEQLRWPIHTAWWYRKSSNCGTARSKLHPVLMYFFYEPGRHLPSC